MKNVRNKKTSNVVREKLVETIWQIQRVRNWSKVNLFTTNQAQTRQITTNYQLAVSKPSKKHSILLILQRSANDEIVFSN